MHSRVTFRAFCRTAICSIATVLLWCGAASHRLHAEGQQVLDRVVAIVNDDVVLESDVEEEERFAALQPFNDAPSGNSRQAALDRLIDRTLVEQQMRRQPNVPVVTDENLDKELTQLRKTLPECARYECSTSEGWSKFCDAHGFTPDEVAARWRTRMVLLTFVEQRFKTGIRISQPEVEAYYNDKFVPRFRERNLTPPPLNTVNDRVEEILLQQRVTALLDDWLKSLHDQGTVQILDPSLVQPTMAAPANQPKSDERQSDQQEPAAPDQSSK